MVNVAENTDIISAQSQASMKKSSDNMELKTAGGYWSEFLCFSDFVIVIAFVMILFPRQHLPCLNFGSCDRVCVVSVLILRPAGGNEF